MANDADEPENLRVDERGAVVVPSVRRTEPAALSTPRPGPMHPRAVDSAANAGAFAGTPATASTARSSSAAARRLAPTTERPGRAVGRAGLAAPSRAVAGASPSPSPSPAASTGRRPFRPPTQLVRPAGGSTTVPYRASHLAAGRADAGATAEDAMSPLVARRQGSAAPLIASPGRPPRPSSPASLVHLFDLRPPSGAAPAPPRMSLQDARRAEGPRATPPTWDECSAFGVYVLAATAVARRARCSSCSFRAARC